MVTHQCVVVLNLLHGRLSCQGKLDDLKVVQLLGSGSTAAVKACIHNDATLAVLLFLVSAG